ncbi:MAG: hypothetical protein WDO71_03425 [Bacteroidota bacterium]
MEQGWDPDVKKFFLKIINSFSLGLLWMMSAVGAGLYFRLAYRTDISIVYVILFYVFFSATLVLLVWYLYRLWNK